MRISATLPNGLTVALEGLALGAIAGPMPDGSHTLRLNHDVQVKLSLTPGEVDDLCELLKQHIHNVAAASDPDEQIRTILYKDTEE